jgi:outer membrane protein TolC
MKKNIFLLLSMLFCTFVSAQVVPLKSILDSIEKNNPLLLSYKSKINAANALVPSANAWMPPSVGLEFDKNPYSFNNFYNGTVRFSLMQEFPNKQLNKAEGNYLSSLSQIQLNEFGYEKNKLFSEAKSAYFGIYIAQKDSEIINQDIRILNSMIDLAEKQMATGSGDMASIYMLKAKLGDKELQLVRDASDIKNNLVNLNFLMNVDVDRTFSIDTNNILKNYRNLIPLMKDSIEHRRSDIMQMNAIINSMTLNQTMMSLQGRPTFGLKFEHFEVFEKQVMYTATGPMPMETRMPNMFSIMGTMTIPFASWSARGYKSNVNAMKYNIIADEQIKQNMVNMTYQKIKMLSINMNSEYLQTDNYSKKIIPAYQKSVDANLLAYGQNTGSLSMVLLAYNDLQMAQLEYLNHLQLLLNVQVDYEKEMQMQ